LVAAETLGRRWIGVELSPNYAEVAKKRVNVFVESRQQQVLDFEKTK
jgi:DNA modification methylase